MDLASTISWCFDLSLQGVSGQRQLLLKHSRRNLRQQNKLFAGGKGSLVSGQLRVSTCFIHPTEQPAELMLPHRKQANTKANVQLMWEKKFKIFCKNWSLGNLRRQSRSLSRCKENSKDVQGPVLWSWLPMQHCGSQPTVEGLSLLDAAFLTQECTK